MDSTELSTPAATDAPTAEAKPGPVTGSFVDVALASLKAKHVSRLCRECGNARSWEHWNLTPSPAVIGVLADAPPLLFIVLTCLKCGYSRFYEMNVLGMKMKVNASPIVAPDGRPAARNEGLIIPGL